MTILYMLNFIYVSNNVELHKHFFSRLRITYLGNLANQLLTIKTRIYSLNYACHVEITVI